jgi:hypothetical protein
MKLFYTAMVALSLNSFSAQAVELFDQQISSIGSHGGYTMYFYLKSDALKTNQCKYEVMYCPVGNPTCEPMMSIALAAKTTDSNNVYLAFSKDADGICTLDNVRF